MNTYRKYCPCVYVAECDEPHEKGETIIVTTRYGNENQCVTWNKVAERNGKYYSVTRADGYTVQEHAKQKVSGTLQISWNRRKNCMRD
jgi:hypothetical protein